MRVFEDFKELKSAVGTEVGVSDWVEVTQDRIDKFADATGDQQWIHVDPERAARELRGGTTIAHGLLSLSLIPMFMRSIIGLKRLRNTLNYGANRIRYLTPVPAGSRLRGRVSVLEAQDVPPDALRVTYKVAIEIEDGGERPAVRSDPGPDVLKLDLAIGEQHCGCPKIIGRIARLGLSANSPHGTCDFGGRLRG
jgi:acyl dehydratase